MFPRGRELTAFELSALGSGKVREDLGTEVGGGEGGESSALQGKKLEKQVIHSPCHKRSCLVLHTSYPAPLLAQFFLIPKPYHVPHHFLDSFRRFPIIHDPYEPRSIQHHRS